MNEQDYNQLRVDNLGFGFPEYHPFTSNKAKVFLHEIVYGALSEVQPFGLLVIRNPLMSNC